MKLQKGFVGILILVLVVIVVVAGGTYFLGKSTSQKEQVHNSAVTSQASQPSSVTDETTNWDTYTDSWITFKYPSNLYAKNGARFGDEHIVSLLSDSNGDYRNGEFMIDSSLRDKLANYNMAVKSYESNVTNPQIVNINNGVVITGTISNQMASNLNVKYALFKYKSGAILIKNEKFTSVVDDQTFDQILSTFKFQ